MRASTWNHIKNNPAMMFPNCLVANQVIIFQISSGRYPALYSMRIFSVSATIILKRKRGSFLKSDPGILAEHIGNVSWSVWASLN